MRQRFTMNERRTRVLLLADLLGPGGTESHLLNLSRLLKRHGAELTLATRIAMPTVPLLSHLSSLGIRHVSTPFRRQMRQLRAAQLWAYAVWPLLLRKNFDVVYTYGMGRFTSFAASFLRPKGRVIWHPFGDPLHLPTVMSRMPAGLVSTIVAESSVHEAVMLRERREPVDVEILPALAFTATAPTVVRRSPPAEVRVSFLGRLDDNKGAHWLVERWPHISPGSARLDLYGDGILREKISRHIQQLGRDDIALHEGWADGAQLTEILQKSDLVVLPSASEGVPLVLLETLAHGVPFVASNVGGIPALAQGNPDVAVAARGIELENAITAMITSIKRGVIDHQRIQAYFRKNYDPEKTSRKWVSLFGCEASERAEWSESVRVRTILEA